MGTIVVTGAASGMCAATAERLRKEGHRVIGIDIQDCDIVADLGTEEGRNHAINEAIAQAGGCIDGVVSGAGMGPYCQPEAIISVNYFGAIAILDGLLPALQQADHGSAVAVASNAAQVPDFNAELGLEMHEGVAHCLAGNESAARAVTSSQDGMTSYITAKHAMVLKIREYATAWGESGVRLNVVCPGSTDTPMLDGVLTMDTASEQVKSQPLPLGRHAAPSELAGPICFLLGADSSYIHGISMLVDGGTDAILRPKSV